MKFINNLKHTKGVWHGSSTFYLGKIKIIRDIFGTVKEDGYRKYNTAYVEIPKKNGKSELAAAIAYILPVVMENGVLKFMDVQLIGSRLLSLM